MSTLIHRGSCGGTIGYSGPFVTCSVCGNLRHLGPRERDGETQDATDWLIPFLLANQLIEWPEVPDVLGAREAQALADAPVTVVTPFEWQGGDAGPHDDLIDPAPLIPDAVADLPVDDGTADAPAAPLPADDPANPDHTDDLPF